MRHILSFSNFLFRSKHESPIRHQNSPATKVFVSCSKLFNHFSFIDHLCCSSLWNTCHRLKLLWVEDQRYLKKVSESFTYLLCPVFNFLKLYICPSNSNWPHFLFHVKHESPIRPQNSPAAKVFANAICAWTASCSLIHKWCRLIDNLLIASLKKYESPVKSPKGLESKVFANHVTYVFGTTRSSYHCTVLLIFSLRSMNRRSNLKMGVNQRYLLATLNIYCISMLWAMFPNPHSGNP